MEGKAERIGMESGEAKTPDLGGQVGLGCVELRVEVLRERERAALLLSAWVWKMKL